jgi:drug/metabolite transporter (DMT)-like permease
VAVALGAVFLGEPVSAGLLAGGTLILAAVLLTTRRPRTESRPSAVPGDAPPRPASADAA